MHLHNRLTDVPGIRVGHAQDETALTGCTVILCEKGAVGGVDQRGGAPGTRQTDALYPMHLVQQVHAIVLTGGSAFGLDTASGVARYLEERGVGFDMRIARVPIVPAVVLFDLGIGRADVRPNAAMGYQACLNASLGQPLGTIWKEAPENLKAMPYPYLGHYEQKIKAKEVLRVGLEAGKPATPAANFTISFAPKGKDSTMTLAWGDQSWSADVTAAK